MKSGYISLGNIIVNDQKNPNDCEAVVNIMGKMHIAHGSGINVIMAFANMLEDASKIIRLWHKDFEEKVKSGEIL